jgi:hypothetical protein
VNHLTDEPILTALRNAADAGAKVLLVVALLVLSFVQIELIVRSTLTLLYSKVPCFDPLPTLICLVSSSS